jgi:hypothetical protein
MNITSYKAYPSGAWVLSTIASGYYVTRTFYGYTKKEALEIFKNELKKEA